MSPARFIVSLAGAVLVLSLSACTYDYTQHTDRVGYHAGDAVKANLEGETVDPSNPSSYDKSGLGTDGEVMPDETETVSTP